MRGGRLDQTSLIRIAFVAVICAVGILITGCGEETENPIGAEGAAGTVGTLKVPDTAPGAPPLLVPAGTPTVTAVGYYSNWQLTKPLTGFVPAGKTIFIKVEFSENMKVVVADEKHARPILYYRIGGKLIRFKIADFGAKGEDFVSGDAKPMQTKASFICKYVVQPKDQGEFVFAVGKWSIDLEGNILPAFYTHKEKLQLGKSTPTVLTPEPEHGITHRYLDGIARTDILPRSAWVLDFPGPYVRHAPPAGDPNDFIGKVCMPVSGVDADNWAEEGYVAPVSKAIVTITDGARAGEQVLTDEGGYYLFKDIASNELRLRVERQWLEPKEVVVYRDRPTMLQEVPPNRVKYQNYRHDQRSVPGVIPMGIRWPDAARFILENETLPHDLLCVLAFETKENWWAEGSYGAMLVMIYNFHPERVGEIFFGVVFHELAHARQDAIAILHNNGSTRDWVDTPEAQAYEAAWKKDLLGVPNKDRMTFDKFYRDDLVENAAEFCSLYWRQNIRVFYLKDLHLKTPNRYKWAETHLQAKVQ